MLLKNTVVNFHQVSDGAWMESVFLLLKKKYHLITANQLEGYYYNNEPLQNSCHITFDDGDDSFYKVVFPIVKKLRVPVSIYVSPQATTRGESFWFQKIKAADKEVLRSILLESEVFKSKAEQLREFPAIALCKALPVSEINSALSTCFDRANKLGSVAKNISLDQLREMADSGLVEIGAHTMHHPILMNENDQNAEWEISASISELEALINKPVKYFAYPNGRFGLDYSNREVKILRDYGIKLAFSTNHRCFSKNDDPLLVPRKGLSHGSDIFVLAKLILGNKWDYAKKLLRGNDENDYRLALQRMLSINS